MVSRLEAACSLATIVVLACSLADWDAGLRLVWPALVVLLLVFIGRLAIRKGRGQSWDQAWGRQDAP